MQNICLLSIINQLSIPKSAIERVHNLDSLRFYILPLNLLKVSRFSTKAQVWQYFSFNPDLSYSMSNYGEPDGSFVVPSDCLVDIFVLYLSSNAVISTIG